MRPASCTPSPITSACKDRQDTDSPAVLAMDADLHRAPLLGPEVGVGRRMCEGWGWAVGLVLRLSLTSRVAHSDIFPWPLCREYENLKEARKASGELADKLKKDLFSSRSKVT